MYYELRASKEELAIILEHIKNAEISGNLVERVKILLAHAEANEEAIKLFMEYNAACEPWENGLEE